jgi:hypothetical protein
MIGATGLPVAVSRRQFRAQFVARAVRGAFIAVAIQVLDQVSSLRDGDNLRRRLISLLNIHGLSDNAILVVRVRQNRSQYKTAERVIDAVVVVVVIVVIAVVRVIRGAVVVAAAVPPLPLPPW